MYSAIVQILMMFFGLSLLPVFYIIFFKQGSKFGLLVKYIVYLILAFVSIYTIQAGYSFYWAFVIAIIGLFEMLISINLYKWNSLIPFSIYILLAVNFIYVNNIKFHETSSRDNILYLYTLVVVFDGMSQLGGQILGRRKLTPQISPNKTIEGFITGVVFCYVASVAIHLHYPAFYTKHVYWFAPLLISLAALGGDLLASSYKRPCGIKDFGKLLPGHGGVLDRFDGVMGAAVVMWL